MLLLAETKIQNKRYIFDSSSKRFKNLSCPQYSHYSWIKWVIFIKTKKNLDNILWIHPHLKTLTMFIRFLHFRVVVSTQHKGSNSPFFFLIRKRQKTISLNLQKKKKKKRNQRKLVFWNYFQLHEFKAEYIILEIKVIKNNLLGCLLAFCRKTFFGWKFFKALNVIKVWNKADGITATVKTTRTYHTDIAHSIAWKKQELYKHKLRWKTCFKVKNNK